MALQAAQAVLLTLALRAVPGVYLVQQQGKTVLTAVAAAALLALLEPGQQAEPVAVVLKTL